MTIFGLFATFIAVSLLLLLQSSLVSANYVYDVNEEDYVVFLMRVCFIFIGQPKRHLLTTGWSLFVGAKRLRAGDSVLFIR